MRITNIRCRNLLGTLEFPGELWEERLCRPLDIYPDQRAEGVDYSQRIAEGKYRMRAVFVEVQTDAGIVGLSGPVTGNIARIITSEFRDMLLEEDPLAVEYLWDRMYRAAVHGRKGADDDGHQRPRLRALGYSRQVGRCAGLRAPGRPHPRAHPGVCQHVGFLGGARGRCAACARVCGQGLQGAEVVLPRQPSRRAGGDRAQRGPGQGRTRGHRAPMPDLMLDCWMSWDLRYARLMAPRLAPYHPRWIEEPVLPDKPEHLRPNPPGDAPTPSPTASTSTRRWGFRQLLDSGAQDVLQPDIYWAGGITETVKIATLASAYDVEVVPHGHSTQATAHLIASSPPTCVPCQEYLVKWNTVHQFFLAHKLEPVNGTIELPQGPGLGIEIDEGVIEEETILD